VGYWSERQLEDMERGWSSTIDKTVCASHFLGEAIAAFVAGKADEVECSYCGLTSDLPIAVHLDVVIGHLEESLGSEYISADELPVDEEGELEFAQTYWTGDLLVEESFEADDVVLDDILTTLVDIVWCRRDWHLLPEPRRIELGWENFKAVVVRRPFFFLNEDGDRDDPDHLSPRRLLSRLADGLPELVKAVDAGHRFFRARAHPADKAFMAAADLGPPPPTSPPRAGRMNLEGQVLFYGAEDAATAVEEVVAHARAEADTVTVGTFISQRPLRLLDLDEVPPVPSIFDEDGREQRSFLSFMDGFATDIARPAAVSLDQYRPTQILTEYVRFDVTDGWGDPIDGIIYRSSLDGAGRCVALFLDSSQCADLGMTGAVPAPTLLLDSESVERRPSWPR